MKYYSLEKAKARWKEKHTWEPLIVAISLVMVVAILQGSLGINY